MYLARVTGSVVSTQKSPSLTGKKLLLVRRVNDDGAFDGARSLPDEVAVDSVGAGEGELVLVTCGSSARRVFPEPNDAIDQAIVAIVDNVSR
ncbi:EutN/CcmL family microcompartment protein [Entomohabitans teleogrylli]|uniref:EutN/CcmL family microcompartment protein n=1 Tax=Entomohabitans teleogrylli TaxID=1384589 RepID=UPI00073D549C|nr:EutN/CcmL family microcompartment protein [Entomohabitans teleogrylli]